MKSAESEAKIEEKVVETAASSRADEEPTKAVLIEQKAEDKPVELPAVVDESTEAKVDDKPVELPPVVDDKCTPEVAPVVDKVAPIVDKVTPEVVVPAPDAACVVEKEDVKSESEKQDKDTKFEPIEEKPEETEKAVGVPELSPAVVIEEKVEMPKESPVKPVEPVEDKDIVHEAECKPQEPAAVVEDKVPEKIEKETHEPELVEEVEVKSPVVEVEDAKLAEKEETCAVESSVEAESVAPKIRVEEKQVDSNIICEAKEVTEPAKDTVEVTEQSDENGIETGKSETGVAEEKSVVAEVAKDSVLVAEEVGQDEAIPRDIESVCEKGDNEDEKVVKGEDETTKEVDENLEQTVESVKKVDEKIEETEEAVKRVDEKTDVQDQECVKDSEDTKTYEDVRKEDVPVKKQSFVKIMKQSLVKAKKAIIGKSQNPKTPASEPKEDGNK